MTIYKFKQDDVVLVKKYDSPPKNWSGAMMETCGEYGKVKSAYKNGETVTYAVEVGSDWWEYSEDQLISPTEANSPIIDINKNYRLKTNKNYIVRVLTTNASGDYPVVCEVGTKLDDLPQLRRYTENGVDSVGSAWDIVEFNSCESFTRNQQVMCLMTNDKWVRRYFSHVDGMKTYCFLDGQSSWTATHVAEWNDVRLPTEDELKCPDKYENA